MGRELQKAKNRSSINKVKQKPKSKKVNIKSNPIIAANWSSKETVSQNYRRLGLTVRLNAPTGGIEKSASTTTTSDPPASSKDPLAIGNASINNKKLIPTEARIERDESGNILRVIHPPSSKRSNPLNDPLNELSDSDDDDDASASNGQNHVGTEGSTGIVAQLEEEAKNVAPKKPRKQSQREEEWVEQLVEKHGDDYRAMFWDRKLNPMQQSEGDIKRRVRRWKESKDGADGG